MLVILIRENKQMFWEMDFENKMQKNLHISKKSRIFALAFKTPSTMRKLFYLCLPVWSILLSGCCTPKSDPVLDVLDETLLHSEEYTANKLAHISHVRALYGASDTQGGKYRYAEQLYLAYTGFNGDSALYYAGLCLNHSRTLYEMQRARMYEAHTCAMQGLCAQALEILLPMESELMEENRAQYYKVLNLTYVWQSEFSTIPEEKTYARARIPVMRDSIRRNETDSVWIAQETALMLQEQGRTDSAIALLRPILLSLPAESDYVRYLANSMGSCFNSAGMPDSALHYFALSAISDMQLSIMEHASLREVALILFRQGDIERAYAYMNRCILDAQFCKARLRIIEMVGDMPFIQDAYRKSLQQKQQRLTYTAIALFIGLILMTISSIVAFKMMRQSRRSRRQAIEATRQLKKNNIQLQETLAQLQISNEQLTQSNRIRDTYVIQYMSECSQGIEKSDQYLKQLLRIALQGNHQKLFDALKSHDFIDNSYRDFYRHFDETFLSLFPSFIDQLNTLLRPDMQFARPEKPVLTTELRVLALIRLGITDTEDIARFLRHSVKTIYNYRTKARSRSASNRDLLEEQIMTIRDTK